MKRITQLNKPGEITFDKESRANYFEMLEQAHRNLFIIDDLHQPHSLKNLMINVNKRNSITN